MDSSGSFNCFRGNLMSFLRGEFYGRQKEVTKFLNYDLLGFLAFFPYVFAFESKILTL